MREICDYFNCLTAKHLYFLYISSSKMSHSVVQNEPFCDAIRAILKNRPHQGAKMYGLFTVSGVFFLLKRQKNPTVFFGNFFCSFVSSETFSYVHELTP